MRVFLLSKKNFKNSLCIGDLVTHVLYGKTWIGMIIDFKAEPGNNSKRDTKALVQIQPGTEFESFFKRTSSSDRVNENLGYVSVHWLFKIKEKNGNARSARNKTPGS